jgi:hypothetical protein
MALPTQVRPGDVISSDLINTILEQIALLGGSASGGSQVVPNVFGLFLGDARAAITLPSRQLSLGFTFDVNGAAVDSLAPGSQNLVVLNQSPAGDARVAPNTPVNLVVSASGSSSPLPVPPPTITGAQTPGGTNANAFAAGAAMVIVGTNFNATASQNTVRFNNVLATSVTPDAADPTRRLLVVIPPGIPGAPSAPGNPTLNNVTISVSVTGNTTTPTTTISITAPAAAQHTIGSVTPGTQFETQGITITGTNFTATAQVFIRNTGAAATFVNATTITAIVPNFADVLPNALVAAQVRVEIAGNASAVFNPFNVRGAP